jgi:hypothetical protein
MQRKMLALSKLTMQPKPVAGSPVDLKADSHSLLPAIDDKANENMGEKETAKGEDMQIVQHTSDTLNPVGTGAEQQGKVLVGLSFWKVMSACSNLLKEGAVQDGVENERQGKCQCTGSTLNTASTDVGPLADLLLNYEMSLAPSPPPESNGTPVSLPLDIESTNTFIARLEAKAVKAARPRPAPMPAPMSDNKALFTPHPDKGFPPVQGWNSTFPFDNINYQQLVNWLKLPGPCVFFQPLTHEYYPSHIAQEIVGTLREVIGDILGHTNAKITAPITAATPANLDHTPHTYLMRNISADDVTKLVLHQCWATSKIGFLVHTAEALMPSYLGAVQGFNMSDGDDTSALFNLVRWTFHEIKISTIIADASKSAVTGADVDPMKKAHDVIDTLNICIIHIWSQDGSLHPIVNLYLRWPFDDDEAWSQLAAVVARTSYQDSLLGSGSYYAGWMCTICHGADHPSGLCPFPLIPGWIKATPIPPIVEYCNLVWSTNNQMIGQQMKVPGGGGSFWGNNQNNTNTPLWAKRICLW